VSADAVSLQVLCNSTENARNSISYACVVSLRDSFGNWETRSCTNKQKELMWISFSLYMFIWLTGMTSDVLELSHKFKITLDVQMYTYIGSNLNPSHYNETYQLCVYKRIIIHRDLVKHNTKPWNKSSSYFRNIEPRIL